MYELIYFYYDDQYDIEGTNLRRNWRTNDLSTIILSDSMHIRRVMSYIIKARIMHDNHHLQSTVADLNTLQTVLSRRARALLRLLKFRYQVHMKCIYIFIHTSSNNTSIRVPSD